MDRLISEQEIKKWLHRWIGYLDEDMIVRMEMCTKDIPSVEPKTGHWIFYEIEDTLRWYKCDQCGADAVKEYDYCHGCGAKMESEQNE